MVWYGINLDGMVFHDLVWYDLVWYGPVWCGISWYGMVWYGGYISLEVGGYLYNQPYYRPRVEDEG